MNLMFEYAPMIDNAINTIMLIIKTNIGKTESLKFHIIGLYILTLNINGRILIVRKANEFSTINPKNNVTNFIAILLGLRWCGTPRSLGRFRTRLRLLEV